MNLSTEERNRLCEQHIPMVNRLASKRALGAAFDEALAVGLAALVESSRKFDPSRGVTFSTYAHLCVSQALTRARQADLRARGHARVGELAAEDEEEGLEDSHCVQAVEAGAPPDLSIELREQEERARRAERSPSAVEATLMRMVRESNGRASHREMAAAAGINHQRVAEVLRDLYRFVTDGAEALFPRGKRETASARTARWRRHRVQKQAKAA